MAEVKIFEIRWDNLLGGLHLMNIGVKKYEDICEIAEMMNKPLLKEKGKERYHVVDSATIYTCIKS
ncbi:hypothetical protein ACFLRC_00480 [Candidatus Altiarchaeota archaeon]